MKHASCSNNEDVPDSGAELAQGADDTGKHGAA